MSAHEVSWVLILPVIGALAVGLWALLAHWGLASEHKITLKEIAESDKAFQRDMEAMRAEVAAEIESGRKGK